MSFASYVYGSGTFAQHVAEDLIKAKGRFLGFIDHVKLGEKVTISGVTHTVQDFREIEPEIPLNCVLGVCSLNGNLRRIASTLDSHFKHVEIFTPVEFYNSQIMQSTSINHYWLTNDISLYETQQTYINDFRLLLSSHESISLYDSILDYRNSGAINSLPDPLPLMSQYLALDLKTPPIQMRAVDAGACQGENIKAFVDAGIQFDSYHAFEPDHENSRVLRTVLEDNKINNFEIVPMATWSSRRTLNFNNAGDASSGLSVDAKATVEATDLDSFMSQSERINFIKMDIEGAEIEAIKGARRLISDNHPHLAISVYHKPTDLWEIGLLIEAIVPGVYDFHLRMYGHQTFDTILYAVPRKSN